MPDTFEFADYPQNPIHVDSNQDTWLCFHLYRSMVEHRMALLTYERWVYQGVGAFNTASEVLEVKSCHPFTLCILL